MKITLLLTNYGDQHKGVTFLKITIFQPANVHCKHLLKAHMQDSTEEVKEVLVCTEFIGCEKTGLGGFRVTQE